jgi:hypothetical protein
VAERHASDSTEQQGAERVALRLAAITLSADLRPERLQFSDGVCIDVDGIDRDRRVLLEVYSRIGPLKPAQKHKVTADMLKLLLRKANSVGRGAK